MSKVVKGIGKAVKGILSGVGKVFKSVTKSSFGKALLFAGATYLGGAALGLWESPFSSINGLFKMGGGPAAAELAGAQSAGELSSTMSGGAEAASPAAQMLTPPASYDSMLAGGGATSDVLGGPEAEAARAAAASSTPGAQSPLEMVNEPANPNSIEALMGGAPRSPSQDVYADMDASSQGPGMNSMTQAEAPKSAIQKVLDFYKGDFAKAALITQVGGALKGAFSPTPAEIAKANFDARLQYDRDTRADMAKNYDVSGVRLRRSPGIVGGNMG